MGNKELKTKGVFIQMEDGSMVNIIDLPKEKYEDFLETIFQLRIAYVATTQK